MPSPDTLLEGLNDEQRAAATAVSGPVVIHAGAGTGKTRVISHRVAYAVATGTVDPRRILVVTFTDKAATEMRARLAGLGLPQIVASTFHAAARRQLTHFWPEQHGEPLPNLLESKLRLIVPLARQLPGNYRFTTARDLADEIEWAKNRRIAPSAYETAAGLRTPPIPVDLFVRLYTAYEQAKRRTGVIDFEDLLGHAIELYETDAAARALVQTKYAWFSVDEYQDTNPLQQALLDQWLGERRDLCVVGDEDQTIYTFTGASAEHLIGFAQRYPDAHVVRLVTNYRSTPQVLSLANRLIAADGRSKELRAIATDGPEPAVTAYADDEAELAALVVAVRAHLTAGIALREIAVLVRTNAQLAPLEAALTRAGLGFTVRGARFYARPDVRSARTILRRAKPDADGLVEQVTRAWTSELGFAEDAEPDGAEARERQASLLTLLAIARELVGTEADADIAAYLADLDRRDAAEAAMAGDGVTLSTFHRAKGLEWDAVFLPMLEDGLLPIRQSHDDPAALAEERRLLYVGITRARRHLALSWAADREQPRGGRRRGRPSRFLDEMWPPRRGGSPKNPMGNFAVRNDEDTDSALLASLRAWRLERSRADDVPAYVVADNKTLDAIAARRPRDRSELMAVPGIGPAKLERYGDELLRVVDEVPRA